MNKKILVVLLVIACLALMSSRKFRGVKGLQIHIDGHDDAYKSSKKPDFCECYHTTQQYWQDDTEVGLGVQVLEQNSNAYTKGWWHFDAESGGSGAYTNAIDLPLSCYAATYWAGMTYNNYNQPKWGPLPWNPSYQCLYVYTDTSGSFTPSTWIIGEASCWFHELANPSHTWGIYIWTQPPSYDQDGSGLYYLTWNYNDANDIR